MKGNKYMKWFEVDVEETKVIDLAKAFSSCYFARKIAYYILANIELYHKKSIATYDTLISGELYRSLNLDMMHCDDHKLYAKLIQGASRIMYSPSYQQNWNSFSGDQRAAICEDQYHMPNYCKYLLSDIFYMLGSHVTNDPMVVQLAREIDVEALESESHEFWLYVITDLHTLRKAYIEGIDEITPLSERPMCVYVTTTVEALRQVGVNWYRHCGDDVRVYRFARIFGYIEHAIPIARFVYGVIAGEFGILPDIEDMTLRSVYELFQTTSEDCSEQMKVASTIVGIVYKRPTLGELKFSTTLDGSDLLHIIFQKHTSPSDLSAVDHYILHLVQENMGVTCIDEWEIAIKKLVACPFMSAGASLLALIFFGYRAVCKIAEGVIVNDVIVSTDMFGQSVCSFYEHSDVLTKALGISTYQLISKKRELLEAYTDTLPEDLSMLSDTEKLTLYFVEHFNR